MTQRVLSEPSIRKFSIFKSTGLGTITLPGSVAIPGNPRRQCIIILCNANWSISLGSSSFTFSYAVTLGNPLTIFDRDQWGDLLTAGFTITSDANQLLIAETVIDEVPTQWQ